MSTRPSVSPRPAACSGAMYSGVPNTAPARVRRGPFGSPARPAATFAMPKSTILTKSGRPSRSIRNTFSGLRSRWTMPLSCAAPSARAICAAIRSARCGGNGAPCLDRVRQRRAVDVLHHRVRHAVGRRAEVGDVDDVRVADARRGLRLLDEALDRRGVAHDLALEHLDRERALDHRVLARRTRRPCRPRRSCAGRSSGRRASRRRAGRTRCGAARRASSRSATPRPAAAAAARAGSSAARASARRARALDGRGGLDAAAAIAVASGAPPLDGVRAGTCAARRARSGCRSSRPSSAVRARCRSHAIEVGAVELFTVVRTEARARRTIACTPGTGRTHVTCRVSPYSGVP